MTRLAAAVFAVAAVASAAAKVLIGSLEAVDYGVGGRVYALNDRVLEVVGFQYDGSGPDARFWVRRESNGSGGGEVAPEEGSCGRVKLGRSRRKTVRVQLPAGMTVADVGWFGVWSEELGFEFGGVVVAAVKGLEKAGEGDLVCAEREREGGAEGSVGGGAPPAARIAEIFPVAPGWSCEELEQGQYQVRWEIQGLQIGFELVGRVTDAEYMAFGPSGSDAKTDLIGSDPVIAAVFEKGEWGARDYFVSGRRPCKDGAGICEDVAAGGTDRVQVKGGTRQGDLVRVQFARLLKKGDPIYDRAVNESGKTFISWAIGSMDAGVVGLYGSRTSAQGVDVAFDFTRKAENACKPLTAGGENGGTAAEKFEKPWDRPVLALEDGDNVVAVIGPSGGPRGLEAIAQRKGWGIAWFLGKEGKDPVLAPTVGVERGSAYTFKVRGGDDENSAERYNPFYITSSDKGGTEVKGEKVYAEPVAGKLCQLIGGDVDAKDYKNYIDSLKGDCLEDDKGAKDLKWKVAKDTPDTVYYQSRSNAYLGWKVRVFDAGKLDVAELEKSNVAIKASSGASSCSVEFKGEERTFSRCRKDLADKFDVYWDLEGGELTTLFTAEADDGDGYIAWGWGHDAMVPGNAVVVSIDPKSGDAVARDHALTSKSPAGVTVDSSSKLTALDAEATGKRMTGIFTRSLSDKVTNGETDAIWAVGGAPTKPNELSYHKSQGRARLDLSAAVAGDGEIVSDAKKLTALWKVHAWMMGIAWVVLAPLAIMTMRFGKKWNPLSFRLHQMGMILVFLLALAAFIIALVTGARNHIAHFAVGVAVMVLAVLVIVGGLFRPGKVAVTKRRVFFILHSNFGRLAWVLAVVNCFLGLGVAGSGIALFIIVGVGVALFTLVFGILSAMSHRFPPKEIADESGYQQA